MQAISLAASKCKWYLLVCLFTPFHTTLFKGKVITEHEQQEVPEHPPLQHHHLQHVVHSEWTHTLRGHRAQPRQVFEVQNVAHVFHQLWHLHHLVPAALELSCHSKTASDMRAHLDPYIIHFRRCTQHRNTAWISIHQYLKSVQLDGKNCQPSIKIK